MPEQRMGPPPATPNAVSTRAPAGDAQHRAEPIAFTVGAAEATTAVLAALDRLPRSRTVEQDERYVHLVVTSRLLRCKDDVEVQVEDEAGLIHYRSASRVGSSDLGVNRKRMAGVAADIRARLEG